MGGTLSNLGSNIASMTPTSLKGLVKTAGLPLEVDDSFSSSDLHEPKKVSAKTSTPPPPRPRQPPAVPSLPCSFRPLAVDQKRMQTDCPVEYIPDLIQCLLVLERLSRQLPSSPPEAVAIPRITSFAERPRSPDVTALDCAQPPPPSAYTEPYSADGYFTGVRSTITIPRSPAVVYDSLSKDLHHVFSPITVRRWAGFCVFARRARLRSCTNPSACPSFLHHVPCK